MLVFRFDQALATTGAEDFVGDILARQLGAAGIVTGDDFTFGRGRKGDIHVLRALGEQAGIATEAVAPVSLGEERISSGRIREALAAGDTATATRLLTRDFAVAGVVQPGDQRGRELGYPTANLELGDYQRPRYGIYAVRVTLEDGSEYPGVASLGIRPTFEPPQELLEAHLFDFDGDLYGRTIEVALHAFIREERKFDEVSSLVAQMDHDCAEARRLLA
jgi:riboflavin kinase/FMN adenylyltransferase